MLGRAVDRDKDHILNKIVTAVNHRDSLDSTWDLFFIGILLISACLDAMFLQSELLGGVVSLEEELEASNDTFVAFNLVGELIVRETHLWEHELVEDGQVANVIA